MTRIRQVRDNRPRKIMAQCPRSAHNANAIMAGEFDGTLSMEATLVALRRGMEIAREEDAAK